tara:strand:- start:1118 stop:1735 length:618 start_codon:yes stop_codon:yes gene_type:complete
MLTIYHAPRTRAFRVIWGCEELGIDYTLVKVDFSPEYRATPEWRALNPVGKVPVMHDGDLTMFESGAMLQYVLDRYGEGRLQPAPGSHEHALYLQWSWFAESTFARPLGEIVNHKRAFGDDVIPSVIDEMKARAALSLTAIDDAVANREYLLGDHFTGADIMMGYTVMLAEMMLDGDMPSHATAYWQRLQARPALAATRAAEASM